MKRKFPKILYFLVCFLLIFEQSGFAQVAGELDLSNQFSRLSGLFVVNKFRPAHLRYISYDNLNNNFNLLLDKGNPGNSPTLEIENSTKTLLNYFFIGISLPNDSFWVNLRPDSPQDIIDPYLGQTDIGKILLEADLQLKKDTAGFTSPQTSEGKEYWGKLYKKAGELFAGENVSIPTLTRPWIVPNEIIIRESTDNAYIYKATLKVMLEQDYLKDSSAYSFKDDRLKILNEYSSQLMRELIIPKLTKEVNVSKRYAPLRQVYYSLILAQWFKQKFYGKSGLYSWLIDKRNLTNLTSKTAWDKQNYFQQYKNSFQQGEYNIKESANTSQGQSMRSYMSGGISFGPQITKMIASSAIVSKRDMFRGVKDLVEFVVSGSQAANDPSNVGISRRGFLKIAGIAAAALALDNTGVAEALEKVSTDLNQYYVPTDKAYRTSLQQGLEGKLNIEIVDDYLKKCIGYSNGEKQIGYVKRAYEFLANNGTKFSSDNLIRVLFSSELTSVAKKQDIVLGNLRLIVVSQDLFRWLKEGISEKWLAIKILLEKTRLDNQEKTPLDSEIIAREKILETMKKIEGIPKDSIEIENMFLKALRAIKEDQRLRDIGGVDYDGSRLTMFNKKSGRLLVPVKVRADGRTAAFPFDTGIILVGDRYAEDSINLFQLQEEMLIYYSAMGGPAVGRLENDGSRNQLAFSSSPITQIIASSPVAYFDVDQNKAMDLLKNDERAWVIFADMLKLSLRNDYYGTSISDIFIADVIRITKKTLGKRGGIGFRLGERSDEIVMVLPGLLRSEEVKNILQEIQEEIKKEYLGYAIARLPDGMVEKIKNSDGIRMVQRTVRERREGGEEYITTALFVKDSGDINGRSTLNKILSKSGQIPGLGEVEEALPPYLPAGAARFQGEGDIESKLESSLKEAEIFQRVAKQIGQITGVERLNKRPETKKGTSLYDSEPLKLKEYINEFDKSLQSLREFVKTRYGENEAKQIQLDDGYAAFMRRNLYEVLEYAIEKAKSADSFIFIVRGPPDNFYIITAVKGKWQITAVRQNILTAEGSSLEKDFLSIVEQSGRGLRAEGKYPFKVINDFEELGHYFGNQLIKLDNVNLLDAFNTQLIRAKEKDSLLDENSINAILSDASRNINNLLGEKGFGFSVNFEAVSVTSDDFTRGKSHSDADIARVTLNIIEKLNAARQIVDIPADSVKFYSEYKGRWQEVENEIGVIAAKKASNAKTELNKVHSLIKGSDSSSSIESFVDRVNKELLENPQYPMRLVEIVDFKDGLRGPNEEGLGLHGTDLTKLKSILENGLGVDQEAKAVFIGVNQKGEPFTQNEAYLSFGDVNSPGSVILLFDVSKLPALSKWDAGKRIAVDVERMKKESAIGIIANIKDKEEIKNIVGDRQIPAYFFEPKIPSLKNLSNIELRNIIGKIAGIEQENYDLSLKIDSMEEQKRIEKVRSDKMRELSEQMSLEQLNEFGKDFIKGKSASSVEAVSSPLEETVVLSRTVFARDPQLVVSGLFKDYLSQRNKLLNLYGRVAEVARKAAKKDFGVVLYPASGSDISAAVSFADTIVSIDNQDIFTVINTFNLFFDKEEALKEQINSYLEKKLELGFHSAGIRQGFIEYLAELVLLGADLNTFKILEDRSMGNNRATTVEFSIAYDNGAKRKIRHTHIKYVFDGQSLPGHIYSELKKVIGDRTDVLLLSKAGADLDGNKKWIAPISNILVPGTTIVSDSVLNITSAKKLNFFGEDIENLGLSKMNNYGYADKSENLGFYEIPVVKDVQPYLPGFLPGKTNESSSPIGGIDFRALPIASQPVLINQKVNASIIPPVPLAELNSEWLRIENMLASGITPSSERIKEYLQSCSQKQDFNQDIDKVLSCIADIFRFEEERVADTDASLRAMLMLLESDKSAAQMQLALAQITVEAKEPKIIE